ncbi:MAG: exopolysaccharide transport family protein [Roseibium sp.]
MTFVESQHSPQTNRSGARRAGGDTLALDILSIIRVMWRRKFLIALIAFVFVAATAGFSLTLTPIFSATTQVLFDPTVRQPFEDPNRPSRTAQGTEIIDSQISVIHSDTVIRPVARANKLAEDPNFGDGPAGLLSQITSLFRTPETDAATLEALETKAVEALTEATTVKRVGQTFVINISVESPSPTQAAVLANAIADSYLDDQRRQVSNASGEVATQIDDRLIDLRERLRKAELEIQKFRAENRLQNADEGRLLTGQELSGLNARLTDARAALAESIAKYDEIERVLNNSIDAGAIGDAVNSETISNLRQQYANAARAEAELLAELLPSHPSVARARSQVERLRNIIREEVSRIAESARIDRQVNLERVAKLEQQLESTRDLSVADDAASIKLRELETEAQATRALYEIALSRAKEISDLGQIVLPNARVITPAAIPDTPVFPKKKLMVVLAGVLGLLVGTAIAVGGEAIRIAARHLFPDMAFAPEQAIAVAAPAPAAEATMPVRSARAIPDVPDEAPPALVHQGPTPEPALVEVGRLPWLVAPDQRGALRPLTSDTISEVRETISLYATGERGPNWRFAEGVEGIVTEILHSAPRNSTQVALLTSPTLGHGQTVTAFALALSAAQRHLNVLLADGEPKQRMLSHDLSVDEEDIAGSLRDRIMDYHGLGISFLSLVSGLPKYKHHRMNIRDAFEFADIARGYDLVIIDGMALPQLAEDDPLVGLSTNFLVTVAESEEDHISMPILSRDLLTLAGNRPAGLVRTMTGQTTPPRRKYG